MKYFRFLAAIFLIGLSACVPLPSKATKESLIGNFYIKYPFGAETLILRDNGRYEQTFIDSSGKTFSNSGKWTFKNGISGQVILEDPIVVDDGFGKFASTDIQHAIRPLSAGFLAGSIVLSENEDAGLYFRKTK